MLVADRRCDLSPGASVCHDMPVLHEMASILKLLQKSPGVIAEEAGIQFVNDFWTPASAWVTELESSASGSPVSFASIAWIPSLSGEAGMRSPVAVGPILREECLREDFVP